MRDIDREAGRLTGHAACIAVDVPTWCRIAGDPLDAVADALADLLDETPSRFELEQLAAAYPIADGGRERAFFGFVDTAEDSRDYMREVPDGADGVKRLADAALAASCATLSPNTADPCLVARLAAESRERSRSLTDPCTQARGAKRAAGSSKQDGTADGRRPAL